MSNMFYSGQEDYIAKLNQLADAVTGGAGLGDMILATAQTVTGDKTFQNSTLKVKNSADSFSVTLNNLTATANRTISLPNNSGTIALLSDISGGGVTTGDKGDIVVSAADSWTIDNGVVTLAKMANLAANSILGNNTGSAATPIALTATQVRTFLNVADGATANTGTVTSVSGTGTVSGLSLSGTVNTTGNITLSGTLAVTPSNFASQTANYVLAAPNGVAGVPTFRALVAADIPILNQNTTGSAASLSADLPVTRLNGGLGAGSSTFWRGDGVWAPATGGGGGSVTSVNLTQPTAGITVSGGPITTSGSITLALADDLAAVEGLATTGIVRRTATNTWSAGTAVDLASEVTGSLPATSVSNTPAGNIAATTVQAAINELDSEKLALTGGTITGNLTLSVSGAPYLSVDTATAGSGNNLRFRVNSLNRWFVSVDTAAETGSNAGGNFAIFRYDDTGAYLGQPFGITRSTGNAYFANNVDINGTSLNVYPTTGPAVIKLRQSAAGQGNQIFFNTGSNNRWSIASSTAAESGSNAGSDFVIYRYNDAGTYQDSPVSITRSTGLVTIGSGGLTTSGTITAGTFSGSGASLTSIPAGQLTGTVAAARLGSGTTDSTTYLRGDGTWQLISGLGGGGTPGGSTTQIQYNNAGAFAGSSNLTWDNTNRYLTIGTWQIGNAEAYIRGPGPNSSTVGVGLTILGSTATSNTSTAGGSITLRAGDGSTAGGTNNHGGQISITGGNASASYGNGGNVNITAGSAVFNSVQSAGSVNITAGTGSTLGGFILFQTNGTSRLQIMNNGAWSLNSDTGSSGQFLRSNGSGSAPTWSTVTLPSGTIVGTTDTQTLTNKTLTTPILSGTASGTTAGAIGYSSGTLSFGDGTNQYEVGYKNIPQVSTSTAYTCVLSDAGKHILHPSSDTTARTFTIPANSSVAYPIGTAITFINQSGAGTITIAITTDTMRLAGAGTTGSRTLAANGIATAIKITSTEWIISGTNLT